MYFYFTKSLLRTSAVCSQTSAGPILLALNAYTDAGNALTPGAARAQRPELARLVHDAVRHQADTGCPQAIILSGASGSGKTYASMVLLRRLFDVAGGGPETDAFKHLAAAFTVLRSLGTAATHANSHSSRIVSCIRARRLFLFNAKTGQPFAIIELDITILFFFMIVVYLFQKHN